MTTGHLSLLLKTTKPKKRNKNSSISPTTAVSQNLRLTRAAAPDDGEVTEEESGGMTLAARREGFTLQTQTSFFVFPGFEVTESAAEPLPTKDAGDTHTLQHTRNKLRNLKTKTPSAPASLPVSLSGGTKRRRSEGDPRRDGREEEEEEESGHGLLFWHLSIYS